MRRHWNRFLDTLSFMTTIRVRSGGFDEEFHRAVMFFPTVGLILGVIYLVVQSLTLNLFGDFIAAVLVVTANIWLTGGLHLDGLGDTFDGLYSYRSRDKIIEIMKDSRVGTNALLVVLLVVLLKVATLIRLSEFSYPALFLMPIAGRTVSLIGCFAGKTAKDTGSGNAFIQKVTKKDFIIGMASSLFYFVLFSVITGGKPALFINMSAWCFSLLFALIYIRHVDMRIGGVTGDILGALCELSEVVFLLVACMEVFIAWRYF